MANRKRNTQQVSATATSGIDFGLAQMEKHLEEQDGEVEQCSTELWDSWPIEEALEGLYEAAPALKQLLTPDGDNLTAYALATLAGRMFLAGRESVTAVVRAHWNNTQTAVPSRAVSNPLPVSDPTAAVSALAQAIYALPQGEVEQTRCLAEQLESINRLPEISVETRSVLAQLVLAVLSLKRQRLVAELKQNTNELLEQTPHDQIDSDVEDILRRSQEEGG